MLRYFYVKSKDSLYVYDRESGFFKLFVNDKWVTPRVSFSVVEHDNDDFAVISEESAKKMSNGVSFDEQYKAYLKLLGRL